MKLSAVILSKGEVSTQKAIDSVEFADEVLIILDSGIKANLKSAKKLRIIRHELAGDFSQQRNFGLDQATGDWVLFLDADELISESLKIEILKAISSGQNGNPVYSAYRFKRRDFFWGRELRYGETHKRRKSGKVRLLKRNSGKWTGLVHEEFITTHRVGDFDGFIDHYSHQNITTFLQKVNMYSTVRANELKAQNKQFSLFRMLFYPVGKFFYTYFIKLGFLDGPAGFVYSFMMSFHSFLVQAKLLNL